MLLRIAWNDLRQRPFQHILTILVAAVAVGISLMVMLIAASVRQGMTDAAMPFDMIVGAKGSATQLLLNTIFLQDTPVGNIEHTLAESLEADARVRRTIPFAFGDQYQGFRIVGSNQALFDLRASQQEDSIFQFAQGKAYAAEFEVVLGAEAAQQLGLKLGDTFQSTHGLGHALMGDEHSHKEAFTVVGILRRMDRPYDAGIFTPIEGIWHIHGEGHEGATAQEESGDVTALMVTPYDYSGLIQLYQQINAGNEAQAIFPGAVMADLFDMLGSSEEVLTLISYVVLGMAILTLLMSLCWSVLTRQRENTVLRAIGAGRKDVLLIVLMESGIILVLALLLGLCIGHGGAAAVTAYLRSATAMYAPVRFMPQEARVLLITGLLGLLFSMVPALMAYRTDVASGLAKL